jgi:hypothetical protein
MRRFFLPYTLCTGELIHVRHLDQPAEVFCTTCSDNFCDVCFTAQHRKGCVYYLRGNLIPELGPLTSEFRSRKRHATRPLEEQTAKKAKAAAEDAHQGSTTLEDAKVRTWCHYDINKFLKYRLG